VKVINICTGGVKTNLSPNAISTYNLVLPETSLYLPIEEYFKKRQGFSNANAIPNELYAKRVVSAVVGARRGGWFWKGNFASRCWLISTFLWKTFFDPFMARMFGLNELKKIIQGKRKAQ
jgi:1-acylglycerone phosphate reductase